MALILLIEDEIHMQNIVKEFIEKDGHNCLIASTGVEGIKLLRQEKVDLILLDISLPDIKGYDICRMVRDMSDIPIVFLTAMSDEEHKLKGYKSGCDDYITKPFSRNILIAKINAILRRVNTHLGFDSICIGDIIIIEDARKVLISGEEVKLTYYEFEILLLFMKNPNRVFSREVLMEIIWGFDSETSSRTVDTHIKTLRKKLGEESRRIVTLIRSGYRFED